MKISSIFEADTNIAYVTEISPVVYHDGEMDYDDPKIRTTSHAGAPLTLKTAIEEVESYVNHPVFQANVLVDRSSLFVVGYTWFDELEIEYGEYDGVYDEEDFVQPWRGGYRVYIASAKKPSVKLQVRWEDHAITETKKWVKELQKRWS